MRDVFQGNFGGQKNGNKKSTCLQYLFYFVMSKGDIYKQTCKSLFRNVFGPFLEGFNSCAVEGISLKVKLRHWESEAFSDVSGFHSLNLDGNWSKRKGKRCAGICTNFLPQLHGKWMVRWVPFKMSSPFNRGQFFTSISFWETGHPQLRCGKSNVSLYVWHGNFMT